MVKGPHIHGPLFPGEHPLLGRIIPSYLDEVRETIGSAGRCVMSIDQALDGIGVSFLFPSIPHSCVYKLLESTLGKFHGRTPEKYPALCGEVKKALDSTEREMQLMLAPDTPRKKPVTFGHVFARKDCINPVILNGLIKKEPTDLPEWAQARDTATVVAQLALVFATICNSDLNLPFVITLEGLAMNGMSHSTSILPVLGIVYGSVWEELSRHKILKNFIYELPISSWKKAFAGKGNLTKAEIKSACEYLGLGRYASDDEQDAVAMCIVASRSDAPLKLTGGRIMPTREERERRKGLKRPKTKRLSP